MPEREIRIDDDPILRMKARRVEDFGAHWLPIIEDMYITCVTDEGIGLAAPQIGESIQLLVVYIRRGEGEEPFKLAVFNPEILSAEGECTIEEGCLSIPGIREEVIRPEKIKLTYQDYQGETYQAEVDGLLARVLQHEIDHLYGVLFIDYLPSVNKVLLKKALKKIAAGEPVE